MYFTRNVSLYKWYKYIVGCLYTVKMTQMRRWYLIFFLLGSMVRQVSAFEPPCTSCKYYIPYKDTTDGGLCKMFKNTAESTLGNNMFFHNYAIHCRTDSNLCGQSGVFYEKAADVVDGEEPIIVDQPVDLPKPTWKLYVDEEEELEQLERDFFELYQKMKKYNTKKIYKTTRDLYKLFKKEK